MSRVFFKDTRAGDIRGYAIILVLVSIGIDNGVIMLFEPYFVNGFD